MDLALPSTIFGREGAFLSVDFAIHSPKTKACTVVFNPPTHSWVGGGGFPMPMDVYACHGIPLFGAPTVVGRVKTARACPFVNGPKKLLHYGGGSHSAGSPEQHETVSSGPFSEPF